MKRLIAIILLMLITISGIFFINNVSFSKEQADIDDYFEKEILDNKASIDIASEVIDKENFIFSSVYSDKTTLDEKEYNEVFSYVRFIIKNNLSAEEILYINSLLYEGYRLRLISEVYDFWVTTNEDIDFIGRCLEVSDEFWGEHWIENAFNHLTENKCGVLETKEEIQKYLDEGLTVDDIYNANVLCRKNVYTIHEILNMKCDGRGWREICLDISPSDVYKYSTNSDEISVLNVQNDLQIKSLMGKFYVTDRETLFNKISEAENQLNEYLYKKCTEKLAQLNIVCDISITSDADNSSLRQKILANGLTAKDIELLIKRGYEYEEIYDVSELVAKERDITLCDAVKKFSGGVR